MTTSPLVLISAMATSLAIAGPAKSQGVPIYERPHPIELSAAPPAARDAAEREFAGLKEGDVNCAVRRDEGGRVIYEFLTRDSVGATHVVDFTADGSPAIPDPDEDFDTASSPTPDGAPALP